MSFSKMRMQPHIVPGRWDRLTLEREEELKRRSEIARAKLVQPNTARVPKAPSQPRPKATQKRTVPAPPQPANYQPQGHNYDEKTAALGPRVNLCTTKLADRTEPQYIPIGFGCASGELSPTVLRTAGMVVPGHKSGFGVKKSSVSHPELTGALQREPSDPSSGRAPRPQDKECHLPDVNAGMKANLKVKESWKRVRDQGQDWQGRCAGDAPFGRGF